MEVLRVFYRVRGFAEVDSSVSVFLSTTSFGTTATTWSEPRVFSAFFRNILLTTSGQFVSNEPFEQDLTDGDGHGILVATDNIFAQINSVTTSLTNVCDIKIMYRWKNVSLQEYIGIVQSQS